MGVARGGPKGPFPPKKILENIVILCFERRFSKQNSVIRLKSYTLPPKKIFGLATPLEHTRAVGNIFDSSTSSSVHMCRCMAADAAVDSYASHLNVDEWTVNIAMLNCFLIVSA